MNNPKSRRRSFDAGINKYGPSFLPNPVGKNDSRNDMEKRWFVLDENTCDLSLAEKAWDGKIELGFPSRFFINVTVLPISLVKRQEIIHEIYLTEINYYEDLRIVTDMYMKNLVKHNIINEADMKTLFSNIEELVHISGCFIEDLKARKRSDFGIIKGLGDIILCIAEKLKIYHIYCSNFTAATKFLQNQKGKNDFNAFIQVFINFIYLY